MPRREAMIGRELSALAARVRNSVPVTARPGRRARVAGSTRHLAEMITASRGPAGVVSHMRVARALAGHPACALDEVLVLAIVDACHALLGTEPESGRWAQRVRAAKAGERG